MILINIDINDISDNSSNSSYNDIEIITVILLISEKIMVVIRGDDDVEEKGDTFCKMTQW